MILRLALHVAAGLFMVSCGIYMQLSLIRRRSDEWIAIMRRVKHLNGRLPDLSFHPVRTLGLSISKRDIWKHIEGYAGLLAIYQNADVILNVIDLMQMFVLQEPAFNATTADLRTEAVRTRLLVVLSVVTGPFMVFADLRGRRGVSVCEAYVALRAKTGLALKAYYPERYEDYCYHFSVRSDAGFLSREGENPYRNDDQMFGESISASYRRFFAFQNLTHGFTRVGRHWRNLSSVGRGRKSSPASQPSENGVD